MSRRQFLALLLPLLAVITGFVVLWALERGGVPGAPAWDADFARYVRDRIGQEYVAGTGSRRQQQDMVRGVETIGLRPVIDRTFPLDALTDAFRYQESSAHFGKICVEL